MTSLQWTRRAPWPPSAPAASLTLPPLRADAALRSGPPVAPRSRVARRSGAREIVDPYRWMENPKDKDWESFMKGQAAYARRVLDSIPGRKALHERVSSSLAACRSRMRRR